MAEVIAAPAPPAFNHAFQCRATGVQAINVRGSHTDTHHAGRTRLSVQASDCGIQSRQHRQRRVRRVVHLLRDSSRTTRTCQRV
jgi:hypothetical protein